MKGVLEKCHALATADGPTGVERGKRGAFGGIGEYPTRVKWGTLAWHSLRAALHGKQGATTE